jgi:hypothetical protein
MDGSWELHACKKHKLNTAVNSHTNPSPNKAIQTDKNKKIKKLS